MTNSSFLLPIRQRKRNCFEHAGHVATVKGMLSDLPYLVTITGTVNGVSVKVQTWLSALQQANTQGGAAAVQSLVAGLMLAALPSTVRGSRVLALVTPW